MPKRQERSAGGYRGAGSMGMFLAQTGGGADQWRASRERGGGQESGAAQAIRRRGDLQGAAAAAALHSSGRSGRIPASRPPRVHAFSWPRDRRRGAALTPRTCGQNLVAPSRGAGGGRGGGRTG